MKRPTFQTQTLTGETETAASYKTSYRMSRIWKDKLCSSYQFCVLFVIYKYPGAAMIYGCSDSRQDFLTNIGPEERQPIYQDITSSTIWHITYNI